MGGITGNCGAQAHQPPARAYKFLVKKASRSAGAAPWSPLQAPVRQVCWSEEREEGQGDWAAAGDAWSAPWDGGAVPCLVTYDAVQDQAWHDWTDAGRADAGAPRPSKGKWPGRKEARLRHSPLRVMVPMAPMAPMLGPWIASCGKLLLLWSLFPLLPLLAMSWTSLLVWLGATAANHEEACEIWELCEADRDKEHANDLTLMFPHSGSPLPVWAEDATQIVVPGHANGKLCTRKLWMLTAGTAPPFLSSRRAELVIRAPPPTMESRRASTFVVRLTFDQVLSRALGAQLPSSQHGMHALGRAAKASSRRTSLTRGVLQGLAGLRCVDSCGSVTVPPRTLSGSIVESEGVALRGSLTW